MNRFFFAFTFAATLLFAPLTAQATTLQAEPPMASTEAAPTETGTTAQPGAEAPLTEPDAATADAPAPAAPAAGEPPAKVVVSDDTADEDRPKSENATGTPAQLGLSGFLHMRTPDITAAPTAYAGFRSARMIEAIGNRNTLTVGYNQAWAEHGEWGVQLPIVINREGSGLNQTFAGGKYRFFESESFDFAAAGYILLPANVGVSETGTGQFGLGADIEMLIEESGVQIALNGGIERADYCKACRRAGVTNDAKAVLGLDAALGLRIPIDRYAILAEYHLNWNYKADLIDDVDQYVLVGGNIAITDAISTKVFAGLGFGFKGAQKNTDYFAGLTATYAFQD